MIRTLALASALTVLAVPALAQDQRYSPWTVDGAPLANPGPTGIEPEVRPSPPTPRPNHMANTNQFRRDEKPKIGELRPMYGSANSLHLERYARPPANVPVKAPPRPR